VTLDPFNQLLPVKQSTLPHFIAWDFSGLDETVDGADVEFKELRSFFNIEEFVFHYRSHNPYRHPFLYTLLSLIVSGDSLYNPSAKLGSIPTCLINACSEKETLKSGIKNRVDMGI
jgi:hypothetical protein